MSEVLAFGQVAHLYLLAFTRTLRYLIKDGLTMHSFLLLKN